MEGAEVRGARVVFAAYVGIKLGEPQSWYLGVGEAQSNAARDEITILSAPASRYLVQKEKH